MKVLSLFDGISCARVALEKAGIPVEAYYASEIDKYAMQISAKNYPDIVQIGSVVGVRNVNPDYFSTDIDLLIGGSPCQDLSIAKKDRKGLDGDRSGLFWEYVRILNEVKPKYFILENVASMSDNSRDLISKALGVEPVLFNASLVSAQQRKRYFWTNIKFQLPEDKKINLLREWYGITSETYFDKPHRISKLGKGGQGDRIYSYYGKSICLSANGGGRGAKAGLYARAEKPVDWRLPTVNECELLQKLPPDYTKVDGVSDTQRKKCIGNAFNVDVVAHILKHIPNE